MRGEQQVGCMCMVMQDSDTSCLQYAGSHVWNAASICKHLLVLQLDGDSVCQDKEKHMKILLIYENIDEVIIIDFSSTPFNNSALNLLW